VSANDSSAALHALNRARSWHWAAELCRQPRCVWQLERSKLFVAQAEGAPFLLPECPMGRPSLKAGLQAVLSVLIALCLWAGYVIRRRAGHGQTALGRDAKRVIALLGEVATRTRHLLQAMSSNAIPVSAVILLGRLQVSRQKVLDLWAGHVDWAIPPGLPLLQPMSPRACMMVLHDLPRLMARGIATAARAQTRIGIREEVAIAFRVLLGTTAARWWERHGTDCEVLFGHTGTADTTLLENAIRRSGGRTVHLVHGQAIGPNFLGFSDLALFRSRYDAEAYARLGCYGRCDIQIAAPPEPRRGSSGVLLLSNLAHPMNAGFRRRGLHDELALLEVTAAAARGMGRVAEPLTWKPHPSLATLSEDVQAELRGRAREMGFVELPAGTPVDKAATQCRWVVTSPSTVALDLLQAGILAILLDPQCTALDTAVAALPIATATPEGLRTRLCEIDRDDRYASLFRTTFDRIGPARALDLQHELTGASPCCLS